MTYEAESISDYAFRSSDELLLDTNIWLYVFGPRKPHDRKAEVYSKAFRAILAAKSRIYIDVLIVSEFINVYARLKWKFLSPSSEFKQFRKSGSFKSVAQDIAADVKRVLKHCIRIESGFDLLSIDNLINEFSEGDSDFNDQVLTALCKRKGLKLVTNDGDFNSQEIPVLTANQRLLA